MRLTFALCLSKSSKFFWWRSKQNSWGSNFACAQISIQFFSLTYFQGRKMEVFWHLISKIVLKNSAIILSWVRFTFFSGDIRGNPENFLSTTSVEYLMSVKMSIIWLKKTDLLSLWVTSVLKPRRYFLSWSWELPKINKKWITWRLNF